MNFEKRALHWLRRDREIDEEFRSHLEIEIEENIESGMSIQDARNEALRKLGSVAIRLPGA
jgi:hypothetical protein